MLHDSLAWTTFTINMELNDLRKHICLRTFEVSVEKKISLLSPMKVAEHVIHCL